MPEVFLVEKARAEIEISEAEIRQEYDNNREESCTDPVVGIITIGFLKLDDAREIIHRCQEDKGHGGGPGRYSRYGRRDKRYG